MVASVAGADPLPGRLRMRPGHARPMFGSDGGIGNSDARDRRFRRPHGLGRWLGRGDDRRDGAVLGACGRRRRLDRAGAGGAAAER